MGDLALGWPGMRRGAPLVQKPASDPPFDWIDQRLVIARHWMVAAANPHAVYAGYAILAKGGSANDVGIAEDKIEMADPS